MSQHFYFTKKQQQDGHRAESRCSLCEKLYVTLREIFPPLKKKTTDKNNLRLSAFKNPRHQRSIHQSFTCTIGISATLNVPPFLLHQKKTTRRSPSGVEVLPLRKTLRHLA